MTGVLDRALVRTDRWRPFARSGRHYAHTSAVPLAYLSGSDALFGALDAFTRPARAREVVPALAAATAADEAFWAALVRFGVLVDPTRPDPVYRMSTTGQVERVLTLYPTNSCNLRCVYCYADSGPAAGARMSVEHATAAVEGFFETLDDRVDRVALGFHGGGEPTTNAGVMEAAAHRFAALASERGLPSSVTTITNATFGPAVLRMLTEERWSVTVSYDGPRQSLQRPTATGADSRDRVVANVRALVAADVLAGVRATVTRDGLDTLRALVDDAAALGVRRVQVEPASVVGRGGVLDDGPPEPDAFAEAFLDAFRHGLGAGVALTTSAWSHTRVGDGRYCAAVSGSRAVTPDGFVSACTEVCDGADEADPFLVGRFDDAAWRRLEVWPVREGRLAARVGYAQPECRSCFMVDTCAGGCPSRARAQSGSIEDRDMDHCVAARRINAELMADLVDGRLLADEAWQPGAIELAPGDSAVPGLTGRVLALVPPFARARWNADPARRPLFAVATDRRPFFRLP